MIQSAVTRLKAMDYGALSYHEKMFNSSVDGNLSHVIVPLDTLNTSVVRIKALDFVPMKATTYA